jgi:ankyrin repeat protein
LRAIIDSKANVDNMDSNGWTALHHAAHNGDLESASTLIQSGANVNAYSNQQKTPLHFAAMNNHT